MNSLLLSQIQAFAIKDRRRSNQDVLDKYYQSSCNLWAFDKEREREKSLLKYMHTYVIGITHFLTNVSRYLPAQS